MCFLRLVVFVIRKRAELSNSLKWTTWIAIGTSPKGIDFGFCLTDARAAFLRSWVTRTCCWDLRMIQSLCVSLEYCPKISENYSVWYWHSCSGNISLLLMLLFKLHNRIIILSWHFYFILYMQPMYSTIYQRWTSLSRSRFLNDGDAFN